MEDSYTVAFEKACIKGRHAHYDVKVRKGDIFECQIKKLGKGECVAVMKNGNEVGTAPSEKTALFLSILKEGSQIHCIVTGGLKILQPQFEIGYGVVQDCIYVWVKKDQIKMEKSD